MTAHVVSFEPVGAPTRAVCSCGFMVDSAHPRRLQWWAEQHAYMYPDSRIEFAGLPPVERAS